MKKAKETLFYLSTFFVITVVLFSFITLFHSRSTVDLKFASVYQKSLNNYKERIEKIENEDCKSFMKNVVMLIENTNFSGETGVDKLYPFTTNADINTYDASMKMCGFTKEQLNNHEIPTKYINIMTAEDMLANAYLNQHVIRVDDVLGRDIKYGVASNAYESLKINQISLVEEYLKIIEGDKK